MAINNDLIEQAIDIISEIKGIEMDPNALLDDIVLVAYAFDDEQTFMRAITQIHHAIHQIVKTRNIGQSLVGNLTGWMSYRFQSQKMQKHPADLRFIYKDDNSQIRIRGFGHRHLPSDVYQRLYG